MIKHLVEQRSEAWHALRLGRVTGTAFKELMSGKATAGYNNLIADIAAEMITETSEDEENYVSSDMQRGIDLEPIAAKYYETYFDTELESVGFITPDEDNKYHEWVGVSPDRLTLDSGLVEIKCPKRSTHLYYIKSGKLPSTYKWQVYGQLFVTGLNYCDFFSYCEGLKPFIIRVYPDEKIFAEIEKELDLLIIEVNKLIKEYNSYEVLS